MNPKVQTLIGKLADAGINLAKGKPQPTTADTAAKTAPSAPPAAPTVGNTVTKDAEKLIIPDSVTARKQDLDPFLIKDQLEKYTNHLIELRNSYANRLFILLAAEVICVFIGMFLYGTGFFTNFDPAVITIFANAVIIQTFFSVRVIVKNLYPEKSFIETLSVLTKRDKLQDEPTN